MTIRDLLNAPAPTLSYELFPPRSEASAAALWETIARLAQTDPNFASITYGASGATRHTSRGVVERLAVEHTIPPLAHLTCVDQSRAEVTAVIEEFMGEGVLDFLALRGDPPEGQPNWQPHPDGLLYASQLVELIREVAQANGVDNVSVGVTAFPAAHAAEQWRQQGLDVLKAKQDAGADFAVTQVFYDAQQWRALDRDAKAEGIGLPILPGIIPLLTATRANRLEQLTGVAAPASLINALDTAGDPASALRVGVTAAADLANELLESGAPGVHIYTFNKHEAALALVDQLKLGR
ncbi:methylenetetrahydrofolate reductase [Demequina aurantiaca]|uniref:methylenetetrahydrofolate reductase n=1 Tax=Demequina aurantiaca TaxID=676200 RepID=UPI003D327DCB